MKLKKHKSLTGKIKVLTGLHIGAGPERMEIGGNDNPIIKYPFTEEPFIPGSSLKGKIRSLLEFKHNKLDKEGELHKWCGESDCLICRIFGTSSGDKAQIGPTRAIFRDCFITDDWRKKRKKGKLLTEDKSENSINRITANATPRPVERVIKDVEFDFELIYRVFDVQDGMKKSDEDLFEHVLEGLKMLERDALGGGGSRGNGKIEFTDLKDEESQTITL